MRVPMRIVVGNKLFSKKDFKLYINLPNPKNTSHTFSTFLFTI